MTTGKTIALTRWTFVGKVMSLLFNMLSSVVITFLPRSISIFPKYFHLTCCSVSKACPTLCNSMDCSMSGSLSFTISQRLLKHMSVKSVRPSNHLNLCHPLLLLTSIFPRIKVFSNELALCIQWPKYWSFSISPCNEYSGLNSFRIDWFDLLGVQATLKSLL